MKVETLGFRITDVPGVKEIDIRPASHDGLVDTIVTLNASSINYGVAELRELTDALEVAHRKALFLHDEIKAFRENQARTVKIPAPGMPVVTGP